MIRLHWIVLRTLKRGEEVVAEEPQEEAQDEVVQEVGDHQEVEEEVPEGFLAAHLAEEADIIDDEYC